MEKLIRFENVSISLKGKVLFPDITFDINKGDRYMLLGKNGSGKSLLMELLFGGYTKELSRRYAGLEVAGHIYDSDGNDLLDPMTRRTISYVTQNEEFHENATFLSEAITACNGIGIDFDEAWFDEMLERFELTDKKKAKIKKNVSCGEGKIIHLITRILKLKAADILLLDEPLNHLSFQNSRTFNDIIVDMEEQNPNLTILMISHCRAITFVDKIMSYDYEKQKMISRPYKSFDCFQFSLDN